MVNDKSAVLNNPQLIPKTKRRTSLSVGLFYTTVAIADWFNLLFDSSFWRDVAAGTRDTRLIKIGAVESFRDNEERDISIHHELDADIAGQIIGVVPKNIEGLLTINRALLYTNNGTGDILEAIGYSNDTGWTLKNQSSSFTLVKIEVTPIKHLTSTTNDTSFTYKNIITIWSDCWLRNNPKEYSISDSLTIIQNVEVKYRDKTTVVA